MHDYLLAQQDRVTGDYSSFWAARDYLGKVDRIRASVFVVHGLNDFNVKTKAFAEWWYRLAANGVERKIWLHNGGHGGPGGAGAAPFTARSATAGSTTELFGVPNGIDGEPMATVQREDGAYCQEADWPAPGTSAATLELGSRSHTAPGTLSAKRPSAVPQSFTDRGRELDTDDVLIKAPDAANQNRLVYRTSALSRDVRMSGTPWVTLRMSVDNRTAANLTAVLVDYGPGGDGEHGHPRLAGPAEPQQPHAVGPGRAGASATRCAGTSSPTTTCSQAATGSGSWWSRPTTTTRSARTPGPSSRWPRTRARSGCLSWAARALFADEARRDRQEQVHDPEDDEERGGGAIVAEAEQERRGDEHRRQR